MHLAVTQNNMYLPMINVNLGDFSNFRETREVFNPGAHLTVN